MASGLGASCGTLYVVRGPSQCRCNVQDMEQRKAAGFVSVFNRVLDVLEENGITNPAGGMRYDYDDTEYGPRILVRYVRPKTLQWFVYAFQPDDQGVWHFADVSDKIVETEKNITGGLYPVYTYYTEDKLKDLVSDILKARDNVKSPFEPTGGTAAFPSAATVVLAPRMFKPQVAGVLDSALANDPDYTQIGALYSKGTNVSDVLVMILGGSIVCGACGGQADQVVEKLMEELVPAE